MRHTKSAAWKWLVRVLLFGFLLLWALSTCYLLYGIAASRSVSWDALGAWGTVTAAGIAVLTYRDSVLRACRLETIKEFSRIRMKYPNMARKARLPGAEEELTAYLRELERFSVGVLEGVYDLDVLVSLAGNLLLTQYDGFMKQLIEERRKQTAQQASAGTIYIDYITVMEQIRRKKQRRAVPWGN